MMDDVTDQFTALEHLALIIIEDIQGGAFRSSWIPRWSAELYGKEARRLAKLLATDFAVIRADRG